MNKQQVDIVNDLTDLKMKVVKLKLNLSNKDRKIEKLRLACRKIFDNLNTDESNLWIHSILANILYEVEK